MKKKGEMQSMGLILMNFITVLVGLVIFGSAIIPQVVSTTSTIDTNTSDVPGTAIEPAGAGEFTQLSGKFVNNFVAWNDTLTIPSGNYTIVNNFIDSNGELTAQLNCTGTACVGSSNPWNISYTYQPVGYITSSGGRSLALLILIFTALAVLVVTLEPVLRNKALDLVGM